MASSGKAATSAPSRLDARQAVDDALGIAVHFAHDGVELTQRQTQVGHGEILPAPFPCLAWHAAEMATPSPGAHRAGNGSIRPAPVPEALQGLAERSASPGTVSATLHRLVDEHPERRRPPGSRTGAQPPGDGVGAV